MFFAAEIVITLTFQIHQLNLNHFLNIFWIFPFLQFQSNFINIFLFSHIPHNSFHILINCMNCLFISKLNTRLTSSK